MIVSYIIGKVNLISEEIQMDLKSLPIDGWDQGLYLFEKHL